MSLIYNQTSHKQHCSQSFTMFWHSSLRENKYILNIQGLQFQKTSVWKNIQNHTPENEMKSKKIEWWQGIHEKKLNQETKHIGNFKLLLTFGSTA